VKAFSRGVAVAVLHILIVLSLGGKLLYDRAHRPRVWVRTGYIDPDLPVRGRYFTLRLQVDAPWFKPTARYATEDVQLSVEHGVLIASKTDSHLGLSISRFSRLPTSGSEPVYLDQGVPFFIPEHAEIPRPRPGEEIWAEVTIPRKGPPRPIQLALKSGNQWHPFDLR